MTLLEQVQEIARPIVSEKNAFIVDISMRGNQGQRIIELFVDTDLGITTGQCADISRDLSRALDVTDPVRGRYHLVVSSPGIDRPLKFSRQYAKNLGRTLRVHVQRADQVEELEGEMVEVTADGIVLQKKESSRRELKFEEIIEARVRAPW